MPGAERRLGEALAEQLRREKAIMGIFDEGCMGMYNAIIPDELLQPDRRLQGAAQPVGPLLRDHAGQRRRGPGRPRLDGQHGMKFVTGPNEASDLTDDQILTQCKMYIAAMRIADDFGCDLIGIQYQQGLKDLLPASDLVEGTLNNADRPPVRSRDGSRVLYEGQPLPHFNEVDECAGARRPDDLPRPQGDGPAGREHAARRPLGRLGPVGHGRAITSGCFLISGSAPPAHFVGGWSGATSERQPAMYFRLGGGTLKGISKPGEIVWSRIFVDDGQALKMDLGRAGVVELPQEETQRRWDATTPQWPIMHAVTYGVSRDQFMARHKANHIQVAYANSRQGSRRGPAGQGRHGRRHGHATSRSAARARAGRSGRGWRVPGAMSTTRADMVPGKMTPD